MNKQCSFQKVSVFVEKIRSVAEQPVWNVSLQYSVQTVGCILILERTVFLKGNQHLGNTMKIYAILAEKCRTSFKKMHHAV